MRNNIRTIFYSSIALFSATMTSCEKQLNEYNPGGSTAEEIWTSPQGFVTAVNAAYVVQREWYGKEDGIFMGETGTDLWFNREKNTYARQNTKYEGLSPVDGNPPKQTWMHLWRGINQCNAGIGRIDNAGFTDMVEKNKRLGELRFLRAFYYWHIVESWGGVMLRTKETDSVALHAKRSPVEDFYSLMIDDLLFAKDNLPISWGAEYGRASKKSAMGLLARVYLSRAYYSPDGSADANSWFTKARDMAQEVITKKAELQTDLWATPGELWNPANNKKNGEANKESLYTITWSAKNLTANNQPSGNVTHSTFLTLYSNKPGLTAAIEYGRDNSRRLMPTLFLLDLFDETKDARYEASFQETWASNAASPYAWNATDLTTYNKDASAVPAGTTIPAGSTALLITKNVVADKKTRPYVVYDRNDIYNADGTIKTQSQSTHWVYPALRKFIDLNRPAATPTADIGYNDIFVIRLAEMYMITAEAEHKLGNNQAAADAINVLRTRAAKPGQAASFMVSAGDINTEFILAERGREFCGEWMRWFDLKRMLKGQDFVDYIKTSNPDITLVQDFHRLRPIPQVGEMDALLNREEFGQNPGY